MDLSVGKWRIRFSLIILIASVFASSTWAIDNQRPFKGGILELEFSPSYYQANANYTRSGSEYVELPSGNSYRLIDMNFAGRYGISDKSALWAATRFSSAESIDTVNTRSKGSFTFVQLGFDYLFVDTKSWDLFAEGSFLFPLEEVSETSDEVLNGEGAMEGVGRLIARYRLGMLEPFADAGFNYRGGGRSGLLLYGFGTELAFKSFSLGGELRGFQSIVDDENTGDPSVREIVALRNGGALRYYAVNPNLMETNFWGRWLAGNHMFKIGAGLPITGNATSAGYQLFGTWSFAWDTQSYSSEPVSRKKDDTDRFQEEVNDGVDQNIFYKPTLPPPVPTPTPAPKKPSRKKLQQDLDQTEFQIELRRQKKPRRR